MHLLLAIWIILGSLIAMTWLVRLLLVARIQSLRIRLGSGGAGEVKEGLAFRAHSKVSIVVAAKDEQLNIEKCLRSLLAQDYPDYEVIAVDDRSLDATPEILLRLAQEFSGRLTVVTIREVRSGWFGKNNAMREGIAKAGGEWLLLTDADCRLESPHALSEAMREVHAASADFLSMIPQLDALMYWERVLQPICALVLMFWFTPSRVNDPFRRTAYANGAFMLIRRLCYDAIGGHEAVRDQLNEDIQLARLAKERGFRLRVVESDGLLRSRMYPDFKEAFRGWSRIFAGALLTPRRVAIAMGMLLTFSVLPWAGFLISLAGAWWLGTTPEILAAVGVFGLAALLMQGCVWRLYDVLGFGKFWSLTYWAGALLILKILAGSLAKVCGATSTNWRGTTYRGRRRLGDVAGSASAPLPGGGQVPGGDHPPIATPAVEEAA